jgi:hypothetical protein
MLSRAQMTRVRQILESAPPRSIRTFCLAHLAAAAKIPSGHLADLAAFVRILGAHGDCDMQVGGICDAHGHDSDDLLVWRPDRPAAPRTLRA